MRWIDPSLGLKGLGPAASLQSVFSAVILAFYMMIILWSHPSNHTHPPAPFIKCAMPWHAVWPFFCSSVHPSICLLILVLLNLDMPCLCKQWRSRSVGFCRSQLIWICTICHSVFEFCINNPDQVIWLAENEKWARLNMRSRRGILIYSAWQGLMHCLKFCINVSSVLE